jgi:hypothetical protein
VLLGWLNEAVTATGGETHRPTVRRPTEVVFSKAADVDLGDSRSCRG